MGEIAFSATKLDKKIIGDLCKEIFSENGWVRPRRSSTWGRWRQKDGQFEARLSYTA
jgi:hypothetical protein